MSRKWKRASTVMSGPTIAWSNVDYSLTDFIKKSPPPQVAKVKKDSSKTSTFKNSTELILHESRSLKKVEACIVSEGKSFVIPYDCPAKVYQLTKAEEYTSLGDLRKALPTCRFFLITSKPKDQQLKDVQPGEVLTVVFKKTGSGSDVFTCERKKLGVKIEIQANVQGGFAPMGTTQERKISDFVRHYSTFPVGIGLTESTLANKAFAPLNDLITQSKSGLIRLTRLFSIDVAIASSLGKKKTIYSIPKSVDLTVTASKALLLESIENTDLCRKLNEDVEKASIDRHLSLVISFGNTENEVLQWSYGDESTYEEVVPLAAGKGMKNAKENGEAAKRESSGGGVKEQVRKISGSDISKDAKVKETKEKEPKLEKIKESKDKTKDSKDKTKDKESKEKTKEKESKEKAKEKEPKEKEKSKEKEKEKSKDKDKQKEKKTKEAKAEKAKVEKSKSNEKPKIEKVSSKEEEPEEPVEDESGYLVPAELLRAQRENSVEEKAGEGKERSSIGISLGRFMDKVKKGKKDGKKSDRPASSIDMVEQEEEQPKRSATMPATSNIKKTGLMKNKAKTMSADDLDRDASTDDLDGPPKSPKDKEVKKRDKGVFGTAGRKAGAKLRHKLGKSKALDEQGNVSKSTTLSSSLPPSPIEDDIDDGDMYVTPVDNQLGSSPCPTTSIFDRQLPELPPEDLRKPSSISIPEIPYDDDDLYDEINPVPKKTFKIPKDLSKLGTDDISEVLRSLNMGEHVPKFRNEQIDGEMFKSLDDKLLGALGVIDPVQKLKVKKLLKGWRPKN